MEKRTMSKEIEHPEPTNFIKFAKTRAKRLRTFLAECEYSISHSESLEATARTEGYRDWNTYSGLFKLVAGELASKKDKQQFPFHVGDPVTGTYRGCRFSGILLGLEETITPSVWRTKFQFTTPVRLPSHEAINLTRQRVRCTVNLNGISVNLKGTPDNQLALDML